MKGKGCRKEEKFKAALQKHFREKYFMKVARYTAMRDE
jgi:hypothetical protein